MKKLLYFCIIIFVTIGIGLLVSKHYTNNASKYYYPAHTQFVTYSDQNANQHIKQLWDCIKFDINNPNLSTHNLNAYTLQQNNPTYKPLIKWVNSNRHQHIHINTIIPYDFLPNRKKNPTDIKFKLKDQNSKNTTVSNWELNFNRHEKITEMSSQQIPVHA